MIHKFPKIVLFILLSYLMFTVPVYSQEDNGGNAGSSEKVGKADLTISGTLYADGLRLENVSLLLKEDGDVVDEVRSDANGKFKVKIKLDKIFTLHFVKDDFADKIVEIDTRNVPDNNRKYPFYYKGWRVDMYPLDLDVDYSILKKPVAVVVYNPTEDGFSTDKKYERSVRPSLIKLADQVYEAYEQKDVNSEEAYDDYMLAVKDGDAFLKEGDYENALMQYEAAKEILPRETYPDKQIKKTMAIMQANQSVDEQYATHIQAADDAFDNKEWETARKNYEMAHDVKPKIEYPKDQIDKIIKNIAAEKALAAEMAEKERKAKYDAVIASADSLLALSKYAESKGKYNEAVTMDAKQVYPKTKIKEIDAILAKNAKADKDYDALMATANTQMNNKEYEAAKGSYNQALALKPDEALPKTKISEIDVMLANMAALKAKEAELAAQKEAALKEQYDAMITSADALMVNKEYEKAKAEYESALALKPGETYPKTQIASINDTLAQLEGIDKQYDKLMASAAEKQQTGKLELAKTDYQAASELKPTEQKPKDEIAAIDAKLAAMAAEIAAKEKALEDQYNGLITSADGALENKDYAKAKTDYEGALALKPKEEYPKTQIASINATLAQLEGIDKQYDKLMASAAEKQQTGKLELAKTDYQAASELKPTEQKPKDEIAAIDAKLATMAAEIAAKEKALEDQYNGLITSADGALENKDYAKAKTDYEGALALKPKEEYPKTQIASINATLAKLEGIDKQYDKLMVSAVQKQQSGKLELAKADYQAASELKPNEQKPKDGIAAIDAKLAAAAAELAAKEKAVEDKYNGFVAEGDAQMALEKYTEAQTAYESALEVKPKEEYPKTQIEVINTKLAELAAAEAKAEAEAQALAEKEQNYKASIAKADQMFKAGDWNGAKTEYQNALTIFEGKTYPTSQIMQIDEKLELLAAEEAAKAKAQAELDAKEAQYQTAIKAGDAALLAKDYTKAKTEYQNAQQIFADKPYPGVQLKKIEGLELEAQRKAEEEALLAKQREENQQKFDALVAEGDDFVQKGELEKGKYKYEAALKLIAGDAVVTQKMRDVSAKIEEARKLAEFHAKNDTEFNRQLAEQYPNGLNETTKKGSKTTTRIVIVANGRGDEYKKEVYNYGAVFYFKNGKKIDESTYNKETKGH